jgi:hypothetical protein
MSPHEDTLSSRQSGWAMPFALLYDGISNEHFDTYGKRNCTNCQQLAKSMSLLILLANLQ